MPREKQKKFYVVFRGSIPGVYESWDECKIMTAGFSGARFASFKSRTEAEQAFSVGDFDKWKEQAKLLVMEKWKHSPPMRSGGTCLAVDAACSGCPGPVEYRGVLLPENAEAFKFGPFRDGTNNIGEFLAIVSGMKWLHQRGMSTVPIFSDSKCAISWVKGSKECNTTIDPGPELKFFIKSSENWLRLPDARVYIQNLHKWDTEDWGEIPADFGRK